MNLVTKDNQRLTSWLVRYLRNREDKRVASQSLCEGVGFAAQYQVHGFHSRHLVSSNLCVISRVRL